MTGSVNLNPSQFSADSGLLDLSLGEVVALFLDREKKRHKEARDDENQQEDVVGCRSVPTGLMMALDGNARRLGVTRALLTRCASHQIAAWLDSLGRIKEVASLFNTVCDAAEEFGCPDLYDDMIPSYAFASSSPRSVTFRTIRWAKNKFYAVVQPLGVPVGVLFAVGLCYSLTRSGGGSEGTVSKYLSAEVSKFIRHIEERSVRVVGFNDLVRRRARDDGLENVKT